jgi:hypothetical protein
MDTLSAVDKAPRKNQAPASLALWLDNEQGSYRYWRGQARERRSGSGLGPTAADSLVLFGRRRGQPPPARFSPPQPPDRLSLPRTAQRSENKTTFEYFFFYQSHLMHRVLWADMQTIAYEIPRTPMKKTTFRCRQIVCQLLDTACNP